MTTHQTTEPTTQDFAALFEEFDQDIQVVNENEITQGRILEIGQDYVLIDIGFKSEGRVAVDEFKDEAGQVPYAVGDMVDVLVEAREDESGQCVLSKERADRMKVWDAIAEKADDDQLVRGIITNRVKGGLHVDIGVKAFLPGSQVELRPTRNLDKYLGQEYAFQIIKFNQARHNIVLSRRALLEEERAELKRKTLIKLKQGAVIDGIVKNITDYGAFVDLGGIDGLLHITDMSWGRVAHPTEMFNVGDEIQVKVLKFNSENERVSLGYKQLTPDPWEGAEERYPAGVHVLGKVVSLIDYGAFVELEEGIEGLIHISEMSWTRRIKHPNRVVSEGEVIEVAVLNLDTNEKKVSLGIKQIDPNPWELLEDRYPVGTRILGNIRNITDFGIFIGIEEGIDGLVHISDISWTQKIRHPSEMYEVGQEVEAVVLNIDVNNERFSLGIKQLEPDPWETIPQRYPPGKIIPAKITKITDFGAFAQIEEGIEGLIHISELAERRIEDVREVVNVDEEHKVEVISVDPKERKIALSIKNFVRRSERGSLQEYTENQGATAQLGDLLKGKLGEIAEAVEEKEAPEADEAGGDEATSETE
ncbi:30S ribosomal protein S1 [Bradymonas sediminis]|uniref:Small ribosomal subunit protein bS1 n=1 Tax=Bradymonas sediminis TaxID=1548548 RepID=A0A2Z4FP55_9DELT|nr:30S ribosomal protein S1 [Bradymonas sediminis]AWV90769.1 30S ribosomal protein S1 [Bradymonas sediminis]TDP75496.1 SSU ribosomal protein S1P [Bradymonas sediminis]